MTLKSKADVLPYMISFHPQLGYVLPNGNLRISWSGRGEDGERLDGYVEVAPDYPEYDNWLKTITSKEDYLGKKKRK